MQVPQPTHRLPALLLTALLLACPAKSAPRNLIVILADDLGWADLGCYGQQFFETPNLDQLAREGMLFTDAYAAAPVCSPTRAALMTGQSPARLGLTDWIPGKRATPAERVVAPRFLDRLPLDAVTVAEHLRRHGYATGHLGKWHLGPEGHYPEDQGFDVNIAGTHRGSPAGGYHLPNRMNLPHMKPGTYLTDQLTDEGIRFIREHRDGPFFLYQSYHSVHTPIQGKPAYTREFERKAVAEGLRGHAEYAAMIRSLDEGVGRLREALRETGVAETTALIFTSDNGGLRSVTDNGPLRAGKGHIYEGGIREPFLVHVPDITRPGSRCNTPVSTVDLLPTLLALAEAPPAAAPLEGVSLLPLLRGHALPERPLFWHYPHYSPQGGRPASAVRLGPWKLIEWLDQPACELYNLAHDPGEATDLTAQHPERTRELQALLHAWRNKVGARLPTANPAYGTTPVPTNAKPGSKDALFQRFGPCHVDADPLGFLVRSTPPGGLALQRLDPPLDTPFTLTVELQSRQPDRAAGAWRNAFVVFGDPSRRDHLIHAGLYLGGQRKLAVFQDRGAPAATVPFPDDPHHKQTLRIRYDPATRTVRVAVGEHVVDQVLQTPPGPITHAGYATINTATAFSPLHIERHP